MRPISQLSDSRERRRRIWWIGRSLLDKWTANLLSLSSVWSGGSLLQSRTARWRPCVQREGVEEYSSQPLDHQQIGALNVYSLNMHGTVHHFKFRAKYLKKYGISLIKRVPLTIAYSARLMSLHEHGGVNVCGKVLYHDLLILTNALEL